MTAHSPRVKHAAGTRNGWETLKGGFLPPKKAATLADIAAIDRGEARRVMCLFRGLYPPYSAKFVARKMDLTPDAVVLRPLWFNPDRHIMEITESVTFAYTRPRNPATDHRIHSFGNYEEGKPLGYAGFTVVVCETARAAGWSSRCPTPTSRLSCTTFVVASATTSVALPPARPRHQAADRLYRHLPPTARQ